jgi:hypothetical protein
MPGGTVMPTLETEDDSIQVVAPFIDIRILSDQKLEKPRKIRVQQILLE